MPTKFITCDVCPSSFSSLPAKRTRMLSHHPQQCRQHQLELQKKGHRRVKIGAIQPQLTNGLTEGTWCKMPADTTKKITEQLRGIPWPRSARYKVPGHGCCALLRVLLEVLSNGLGNKYFRCSSIRLDRNSVAKTHIMAQHAGPSLHLLLGNFKGGTFHSTDSVISVKEPGKQTAYNSRKPHLSELFCSIPVTPGQNFDDQGF